MTASSPRRPVRVVRLEVPRDRDEPFIRRVLSLADDRWVACVHGGDLLVHDLARADTKEPVLRVEGARKHAIVAEALVTCDAVHGFRRFARRGDGWVEVARFAIEGAAPGAPYALVLSPSGRFLSVQIPSAEEHQSGSVALLDAWSGRILATSTFCLSARASFARLDGREVLFLSAPDYMSVALVDCESGHTRATYAAQNGWDFCHTDYDLSADGTRLLVFGCVWAAPYEARLYDATPWTRRGVAAGAGFPLPCLRAQGEALGSETVLPPRFVDSDDGLLDVLSLLAPGELPEPGSEDDADLVEQLEASDRAILDAVRRDPTRALLLQRRFDPRDGSLVAWALAPIRPTGETHVHALAGHQALLVNEGVQWFDGFAATVEDVASFVAPRGRFDTAVTRDGGTVVIRATESG